ncbi:probable endonuclease 4 isoform X1 [Asterias rubens]|uniref:probable endonuclease 4 isoform X1 n=1 Tax=Asterias rubens TaxID=7604 RepID=UPI0014555B22|nr:probable endonuclease 4 isoform X1 [Asterias rubens]
MKPKNNAIKSQRSSTPNGKKKKRQISGHGLGEDAESKWMITETVKQKLPKEKNKETPPEVIVGKLRKSKSEIKTSKETRSKKSSEGAEKPNEKALKNKVQKESADGLEPSTEKKKKLEKGQLEVGVGRKRKIVKKVEGVTGAAKQSQEDSKDRLGVGQTKTRSKRIQRKKEWKVIESQPDISEEKPKRKRSAPECTETNLKQKKQKLNAGRKTQGELISKKSVRSSVDSLKSVALEVKAEVKGDMAKAAKFVGAHMSAAGGLENAVKGAVTTGAKAFALFLRSQRQWAAKPLEDKTAETFRQACQEHKFSPDVILPHGSYLLNCGSPNAETLRKSREALADELNRCEKLGLTRYNFHPGSTCGEIPVEECLDKIGESINMAHQQTNKVMTVIENMSRQGNTVGGKFEELHGIIERVKDKARIGVCLDTCHAFAAGFDLSSESGYQDMMEDFERIVGLKYLVAVHLNDSKGSVGSHLDRHEKIGQGHIGIQAFRRLINDPRFDNIPLILETPVENGSEYAEEIELLYSLVN